MDWKIELILLPVADVDRSKAFYTEKAGFALDVDVTPAEGMRVVQMTPPGSACSIGVGTGILDPAQGPVKGLHLIVPDIEAAHAELTGRGVQVSDVRHMKEGQWTPGVDPGHPDYNSFADFTDPDGNTWVLQEVGHNR